MKEKILKITDGVALAALAVASISVVGTLKSIPFSSVASGAMLVSTDGFLWVKAGTWMTLLKGSTVLLFFSLLPNLFFEWPRRRGVLGAIAAVGLIAFLIPASEPMRQAAPPPMVTAEQVRADMEKNIGALTLDQFSEGMRVPVSVFRQKLQLPASLANDKPIAQFMALSGKRVDDFQKVVFEHHNGPTPTRP